MLVVDIEVIKRQGRRHKGDRRVAGFRKRWGKFDWTRMLVMDNGLCRVMITFFGKPPNNTIHSKGSPWSLSLVEKLSWSSHD
jgi:hypothetical protein